MSAILDSFDDISKTAPEPIYQQIKKDRTAAREPAVSGPRDRNCLRKTSWSARSKSAA